MDFKSLIRDVPDFPKKGIVFKDITPLLKDPKAFQGVIQHLADRYKGRKLNAIVAMESRGFIFGAALATHLGVSFVPVRKPGKLPWKTIKTPSPRATGFSFWTTSWPPAEPPRPRSGWSSGLAARSSKPAF
jgi:adenine/guanine phosphoribosyltransferase-like PRPP-binding protein